MKAHGFGGVAKRQNGGLRRAGAVAGARAVVGAAAGPELKFLDTTRAQTTTATAGAITNASLNIVAEGVGESQRIGRKIVLRAIHIQGTVLLPTTATAADTSDSVRVVLYQDKQTNGAAAAVTDILESADYRAFNNLSNKGRFRTLADTRVALDSGSGSGRGTTDTLSYGESQEWLSIHKVVNIPVEFDNSGTDGAITTQRSNNIGVLVISQSARASVGYIARVRYTDG